MKTNNPLVSIIIVNWNGGDVFDSCLKSLSKLAYPNWELIVVDNASNDGSELLPKNYKNPINKYTLIKNNKNLGFAPANNKGYKSAKGDYILLLNNDTKVTPSFLTKMVKRMQKDMNVGVLQPKIYMMDEPNRLDNAGSFLTRIGFLEHWGFGEKDSSEFDIETAVFSAKGACMLIKREVIEKVGLFDDAFKSYFEESDFCWRVWLGGWKVLFFPKAHIYHKVGFTLQRLDVSNINFDYYKNRISSLIKNLEAKNMLITVPLHLVISFGIAFAFLVRGNKNGSFMIVKAFKWNILSMKTIIRKRKIIQENRVVSDAYIWKELSRPVNFVKFFGDFKRVDNDMRN